MAGLDRRLIPNILTVGRIVVAPALFLLPLHPSAWARLLAFVLFVTAAVSDLWDGYLARKYGWITDFGKLMDPLADKLMMVATLVPLYMLSNPVSGYTRWPLWDSLPLWVVLVIFLREGLITALRTVAARRGIIIPAGPSGKHKALIQNIFVGSGLLWYALHTLAAGRGWTGSVWEGWRVLHGTVLAATLLVALVLTVWSMLVYLWQWRLLASRGA